MKNNVFKWPAPLRMTDSNGLKTALTATVLLGAAIGVPSLTLATRLGMPLAFDGNALTETTVLQTSSNHDRPQRGEDRRS